MLNYLDKKLLVALMKNARAPISQIVKTPGLTREIVRYRLEKLTEQGIIKSFVTKIHQPFFATGAVGVMVKCRRVDEKIIESLTTHPKINWVSTLSGTYDIMFSVVYDSIVDYTTTIEELELGDVQDMKTMFYLEELKFDREGLITGHESEHEKLSNFKVDSKRELGKEDKMLLQAMSSNARVKNVDLARITGLSEDAVRLRIKKLESKYIIRGYTLVLDTNKMGYEGYQLGLKFDRFTSDIKLKLKEYVRRIPYVTFCVHTSGDYNVLLALHARNRSHFNDLLADFRKNFDVRYEFQLQMDEFKEVYVPEAFLKK